MTYQHIPENIRKVLGDNLDRCESRSIIKDRLAYDGAVAKEKKDYIDAWIKRTPVSVAAENFATNFGRESEVIYAQLQSRLMINMGGGVMENADLSIDRFGVPVIPGSAVKGCARRAALAELSGAPDKESKAEVLAHILHVFGWTESELKKGRRGKGKWHEHLEERDPAHSDLWLSMSDAGDAERDELWDELQPLAMGKLAALCGVDPGHWKKTPRESAGRVGFIQACPLSVYLKTDLPMTKADFSSLEVDILNSHHQKYYGEKDGPVHALDSEDPVPIFFPAVKAGQVFFFRLVPIRGCAESSMQKAVGWLKRGLCDFGLGAKTNAGYGFFADVTEAVTEDIAQEKKERARKEEQERLAQEEAETARRKAEEKKALEAKMATMSDEEKGIFEMQQMSDDSRREYILKFTSHSSADQEKIYQYLTKHAVDEWLDMKDKAEKAKQKVRQRYRPVVDALFALAKSKKEKMPK